MIHHRPPPHPMIHPHRVIHLPQEDLIRLATTDGLWIVILVSSCIVYHDGVMVHFVEGGALMFLKRDLHLHQNGSRDMTIKDH